MTEASRLRPDAASILNLLGVAHAMLGRGESAVAILRAALALAPNEPAIHRNLGMAEEGRGNVDRALVHYRESLDLIPDDPASMAAVARILKGR